MKKIALTIISLLIIFSQFGREKANHENLNSSDSTKILGMDSVKIASNKDINRDLQFGSNKFSKDLELSILEFESDTIRPVPNKKP